MASTVPPPADVSGEAPPATATPERPPGDGGRRHLGDVTLLAITALATLPILWLGYGTDRPGERGSRLRLDRPWRRRGQN